MAAGRSLSSIVAKAVKMGCIPCQFDARMALGRLEMKAGQTAAGRSHLQALERDAQAADFRLVARQAAEAESSQKGNRKRRNSSSSLCSSPFHGLPSVGLFVVQHLPSTR